MQKLKRKRGATLGLVSVVALVILLVGMAVFLFVRLLGGARELGNATDAGILNVCKKAFKEYQVDIPMEFSECAVPAGTKINLLTYNRMVAQALIVAMNAEELNTPEALANARRVWGEVEKTGKELADALSDDEKMGPYFEEIANANNRKMFGQAVMQSEKITNSYMKPGSAANVYLDPLSVSDPKLLPRVTYSEGQLTGPNGLKYLGGYKPMSFAGIEIWAVPTFPQQAPHLVSLTDFNKTLTPPTPNIPPNSFRVDAVSTQKNKEALRSVAAAVVGAVTAEVQKSQFPAAVPGGYVEIANSQGAMMPAWRTNYDAMLSIFNREVYYGLEASSSKSFSIYPGEVGAWAAYNASTGSDANGRDASLFPPSINAEWTLPSPTLRHGAGYGQLAGLADALEIRDSTFCDPEAYDYDRQGLCADVFPLLMNNYGRKWIFGAAGGGGGCTNVEYAKGQVMDSFADQNKWYVDIEIADLYPSGVKWYKRGQIYPVPCPEGMGVSYDVKFGRTGTINELIEFASSCPDKIMKALVTRCKQIRPESTEAEIKKLLDEPLPVGANNFHTVYIYRENNALVIKTKKPPTYSGVKPDGEHPFRNDKYRTEFDWGTCSNCMQVCAQVDGTLVNTAAGMMEKDFPGTNKPPEWIKVNGDGNSLDRLFLKMESPRGTPVDGLWAYDRAAWHAATGSNNLLGRLEFSQYFIGKGKATPGKSFTLTNPN